MYGRVPCSRTAYAALWTFTAAVGGSFKPYWTVGLNLPVLGTGTF